MALLTTVYAWELEMNGKFGMEKIYRGSGWGEWKQTVKNGEKGNLEGAREAYKVPNFLSVEG